MLVDSSGNGGTLGKSVVLLDGEWSGGPLNEGDPGGRLEEGDQVTQYIASHAMICLLVYSSLEIH